MKPSEVLNSSRKTIREIIGQSKLQNPRIFGSVLHGTDKEGSDLDILVDAPPGTTLFDIGGLLIDLEDMLGIPIDLLTPNGLPAKYREQILLEAKPL
jgi:uncharacterized protein